MMRLPILLLLSCLLACGCSRDQSTPKVVSTSPAPDPAAALRRDLFGDEALASNVQWRSTGLGYRIDTAGQPPTPGVGVTVRLLYTGRLKDGTVFDKADKPVPLPLGSMITGLSSGIQMLGTGGKAVFFIPPSLGYGGRKVMGIPPNSGLIFDVELVGIESAR